MNFSNQTIVDTTLSIEDRISFLKYCCEKYETDGTSPISDYEFDTEFYKLQSLVPDHLFFKEIGGIDREHIYGATVKHDFIMGSLSKSLTIEDFKEWINLNSKILLGKEYILQPKVDGLSLSLIYNNGELIRSVTRGDGEEGIDVTANSIFVSGVKKNINHKEDIEIRGECFKERSDFYKNWVQEYKNPRNFASGSMFQKNAEITKERGLSFVSYEIMRKEFDFEESKNKFLDNLGFITLNSITRKTKECLTIDQLVTEVDNYMKSIDRYNLPFDIDGIVVKMNDIKIAKTMGVVANKPKSSRAVKFPPIEKETIVIGIETNTGRSGKLTPVALLSPVDLCGSIVQRATLHNYKMLTGNNCVGFGSKVIIAKQGDIVPQIIKVISECDKRFDIPTTCPSCGKNVRWNDTNVDLICDNINCPSQLESKIDHYLKCLSVKGIGKGILEKLTDKNIFSWDNKAIINSLPEIYYMLDNDTSTSNPISKYTYLKKCFGEIEYQNIVNSIHSIKEVPIDIFVQALGISKIGSMAKDITSIAPSISDIDKLTINDLISIDKFGDIKAKCFIDGWKEIRNEVSILLKYITIKQVVQSSKKLEGKKFCFTGSFSNPSRTELEKMVGEHGGKLSSVGKGLTALVFDGETTKGKYQKAIELNIPIISQQDFLSLLK